MAVECTGRNVEVTSSLKELAEERAHRLERHLGSPADVRLVLSHEKHRFGAEVIAIHGRRRWKAQEETGDPRAAVAAAFEKIDAQAMRDTERRRDRKHRGWSRFLPKGWRGADAGGGRRPAGAQERARRARPARRPSSPWGWTRPPSPWNPRARKCSCSAMRPTKKSRCSIAAATATSG